MNAQILSIGQKISQQGYMLLQSEHLDQTLNNSISTICKDIFYFWATRFQPYQSPFRRN